MEEIVAADGNVAERVFQQRAEMRREARILHFAKKLRLQRAAERPAVNQEREEEPPAARVPLAVEKLALSLERLEGKEPLDLPRPAYEKLDDLYDCPDELRRHSAREGASSQQRLVRVPEFCRAPGKQRSNGPVCSQAPLSRTAGNAEEAEDLRHRETPKRRRLELDQMVLRRVEIHRRHMA